MNLYRLTKLYARPFWKRSVRLNRAATLAIFCAAPLSAPCAEISGQVYIVTKAHETVKLALVPVEIYRAEDVRAATKAVDADLKLDRERMATFMSNLRQAQALAKAAHDALWNSADTLPKVNAANRGTVEVQVPSSFSYKVTQTIRRGEPALERDELEGILTLQNNAAHAAVDRGDLVRGSKARRLRRLARSRELDADE